jgi:hypothetical protein
MMKPKKDVLAARLGEHRPELGERQSPAQGGQSAREPHDEQEARRGEIPGGDARGHEDPGTDHGANDQERRVDEAEPPQESALGGISRGHDTGPF